MKGDLASFPLLFSTCHDRASRVPGLEYEGKLNQLLEHAGISFWTEDSLRSQGSVKTPDAKLQASLKGHHHMHTPGEIVPLHDAWKGLHV